MEKSQSRYGIMEELNSKKLRAKQELSTIIAQKEETAITKQTEIDDLLAEISRKEGSYELIHKQEKAQKEAELKIAKTKFERVAKMKEEEIVESDENYKADFELWKDQKEREIEVLENDAIDYKRKVDREIEAREAVLKEMDAGIVNLKEISKDQKDN